MSGSPSSGTSRRDGFDSRLYKIGEKAILGILEKVDFFGEGRLVWKASRMKSATAMTDCEPLRIDKKAMMLALQREHAFSGSIRIVPAGAEHPLTMRILSTNSSIPAKKTTCSDSALVGSFRQGNSPETVIPQISEETLAEMIGTTRSRVTKRRRCVDTMIALGILMPSFSV